MNRMTLGKGGLLSLAVPAILATSLAAEASTERSRDNHSATPVSDRPNATTVSVSFRDGLLSFDAKAATWMQVLNDIAEQTGIRFHHSLPFAGSVTVSFANLPVRQAIERLFGPEADFMFRYDGTAYSSSSVPKEVWVLGKVQGEGADGQQSAPALLHGAEANNESAVMTDRSPETLLRQLAEDDPAVRFQAITALIEGSGADNALIHSSLQAALKDKDPAMRGYAVQTLAQRDEPNAIDVLGDALRDDSVDVRSIAVASIDPARHGLPLLQEALRDPDELIRFAAAERLDRIAAQPGNEARIH